MVSNRCSYLLCDQSADSALSIIGVRCRRFSLTATAPPIVSFRHQCETNQPSMRHSDINNTTRGQKTPSLNRQVRRCTRIAGWNVFEMVLGIEETAQDLNRHI